MFKRILVPVDPAKHLGPANEYAAKLALRFDAQIIANYVLDESLMHGAGEAVQAVDDAMEWVGADALQHYCDCHPEVTVLKRVSYGHTATCIFQSVLGTGADLVVVGGYRQSLNANVWGSTVADIVHHDERPTFVVRRDAELPTESEKIIVPFDGSDRAVGNLHRITRFAKELNCKIDLLNVAKKNHCEQALHLLRKGQQVCLADGVEAEVHCVQASRWKPRGRIILDFAKSQNSPLIALSRLGSHSSETGRSRTVAWLLTHSEVPVWVVRK
jgi:nucleotide-binding universal stress UspA family protein